MSTIRDLEELVKKELEMEETGKQETKEYQDNLDKIKDVCKGFRDQELRYYLNFLKEENKLHVDLYSRNIDEPVFCFAVIEKLRLIQQCTEHLFEEQEKRALKF